MKLHLPYSFRKALLAVLASTMCTTSAYGAGMHSQVSIVTYTDFGQNMGRYRVNGVNDLLSSIRRKEGGVVITYLEGHDDYTLEHDMPSFESQVDSGAFAAVGYNFIATVQHNNCQNPTFTGRYLDGNVSLHYYGVEYRDALTFCLAAQSDDQTHTHDYKLTRMNRLITDVTPSTPAAPMSDEEILALAGTMEYRSGAGRMSLWSLDGTNTLLQAAYIYAIGGMRLIDKSGVNNSEEGFFTTTTTMDYSAQGISESDPLPFAPASGDSGSPVWIWDEDSHSYVYLNAYQSIFQAPGGGARSANARGAIDYTWKVLDKFNKEVTVSGSTVHITGVAVRDDDQVVTEGIIVDGRVDHTYTAKLHKGSVLDAQGNTLQQFVGVRGDGGKYINTWLNLSEVKNTDNWFAYDNKYYNVGVYDNKKRELEIQNLFFTENLVFQASSAADNTVAVDADTDMGIGYVQFGIAPDAAIDHADFTLQSNSRTSGGRDGAQRDFMLNSAGFVVDANVNLHVKLTNTEWDSTAGDYYYREWRKVGDGNLYLEGSGNNEILLNVGGSGKTYLAETGNGYAAYNVFAGSGATVVLDNINQIARGFTFGYTGATLDIRGNNSMDWYLSHADASREGFAINSQSEDAIITNSGAGTLSLTYKETGAAGESEYLGSFVDTATGAVHITFNAGAGSETSLHSIHTDLSHNSASGITVQTGKVVLSGTNTVHARGSASGRNADRYFSADDWHYADMAAKVQVESGATFELGSHARLDGNVTLESGATAIIREGVHSTYEYIEGGLRPEDTTQAFYRDFYGLKGDIITVAGSTVRFEYSPGTSAEQVYGGNITGGGNAAFNLGGSGATLRLSGTNTFSGIKSLSGGGLISDNDLAALGLAEGDSNAWHVAADAFIAANGTTGAQLLPLVKKDSAGVLALTADQAADLNLQQLGYSNLFVGALAGKEAVYGTAGTQLATVQNGGKNQWLLGGGGGNLVVDFALQDNSAELVLGNEYTTGSVTLTNTANTIGTISFKGQVTLNYTSEEALGHATVDLNYTNRMQLLSLAGLAGIAPASSGVVLVDKLDGAALDMTTHPELYIGSSSSKRLDAAPVIASGAAYRFGGIDGALTVNAVLADVPGQHTGLYADGQTFSGGVLELAQAATITGAVDVRGYDPARMLPTMAQRGDITLRLAAADALSSASSVTMEDGGIIDICGTTQTLNNLSVDAGGLVTDSSLTGSGVLNLNNTTETTISGVLDVALVNKVGSGTLNLSGTSLANAYNVQEGTLNVSDPAAIGGIVSVRNGAALSLAAGDYSIVAALSGGANLRVADNATATVGSLALEDNTTVNLSGGTLKFTDTETIVGNGITLNLAGGSLALAIDDNLHFTNTLRASGGKDSTVTVSGGNKDTSYTRVFDNISVDAGSTLTLTQDHQETCPTYTIHNLTGAGKLVVYARNYKDAPAHYILDRDTAFAGTFTFKAGEAHSGHPYMSHLNIQSENALANAQLQMYGWSGATGYITLGIDTDNANVQGLSTENTAYSVLMAGYTKSGASVLPVSTRRATLTILGSENKDFKGIVSGGDNGNGLSIVMNGTGTQTFSGSAVVFNNVSALDGTLVLNTGNLTINEDVTVARGAELKISQGWTLGAGHALHVVDSASGGDPATLTAALTLNGGTIDFSGEALNSSTAALSLSSNIAGSATISFSETSLLQTGVAYKLASGDWSKINLTTASLDYLTANVSATTGGLTATFSLRGDSYIWDGNSGNHTWTASTFGQRPLSFQNTYRAVFTDAAASKDVQVNASVSAASLIIDSTDQYTFGGKGLVTAASLSQIGSGTTSIGNTVKVTGQAHVQAGTLAMFSGASTGSVLVDEGSTLTLKNADVTTGTISGDGTLAIDWGNQSGSIPAIGESGIGTLRVVSGTLTTAAQPNVKNGVWVEQGGTLSSGTGAILPAGQALHLAGSLELNLSTDSLQTSISGYNGAKGSVLLNSTGTSTIAANTTVEAQTLTVNSGTVSVDKAAALMVDSLAVGPAATAQLHRDGGSIREIGSVQMAAGAKLSLYSDSVPATAMGVDSLVLGGASASVVQDYISGAILFRSLSRTGDNDATLNLDSIAAYQNISVFELGGADDTPGDFAGEITLNCTSGSNYLRSSALMLNDANVAAGAVINLKSANSNQAVLALGVNAEVVNIAGLVSNSGLGNRTRLFSGSVAPNTMPRDEAFVGSEDTHRLVITTASGKAYDFHGRIGRNVDLTVGGGGTQRLLGSAADFNGMLTVQGGTLEIGNAPAFGSQSEIGGFNATLAGGTLALRGGALNLGSGGLLVTGDTSISLDTAGEYSYRDGRDSENGFSLMTVVSAATAELTAGTLTGLGVLEGSELMVMDNGVYALDSTHGHAYYVNTTVDYGPQAAGTAYAHADSLVLNRDGAVLNMQAGLSTAAGEKGITAAVAGGTVNLAQGVTLHQSKLTDTENVKIGGVGTYQAAVAVNGSTNTDTTLGVNKHVTLADGWAGTVELVGAGSANSHLLLESYGNSASTVKLTGTAGWLTASATVAANLLLEDSDTMSALTIKNGTTGGTETFNGSISGSGTMEMAWDSTLDFKFNGDLSNWTGAFKTTTGTANVYLLGSVADVAAAIQATSLTVGSNVTFHNTVKTGSLTANGGVTVGENGTLDLTGLTTAASLATLTVDSGSTLALAKVNMLATTGTLAVENGATLNLTGLSLSGDPQSYVLATGGSVTLGDSVSFTLADETLRDRASLGVVDGTSLVLTLAPAFQNLVWQGPNGQWTTDAAQKPWYREDTQTAAPFKNGDNVRFGTASSGHTATLGADITAAALTVNENASVTLALNGHALATETLTVDSGSTLTVNGSGRVMEAAASTIGGSVVLGSGTTLKLNGGESDFTIGRVTLNNGAKLIAAAAGSVTATSVFVADGSAAEISLAKDMTITAGGSADDKAGALYTMGAGKTLSIHSADAADSKTLTVDKLDIANHNTAVSLQNVTLDVLGAATVGVLITDRSNDVGSMTVGGGAALNFNGSVDWHKAGSSDVVNLTVQNGGAVHVNKGAANTLNNITVQDGGVLSFAAGTSTALFGALSLQEQLANSGTLDFGGRAIAVTLGGDDAATTFGITPEGYADIHDREGDNGFHHTMAGDITSGSGSVNGGGSVAITLNGTTVTGVNTDGTFGTVDTATYHVRSGSVDYGAELAGTASITTVAVSGNATLNLNTGLANGVKITSAGGTVNIGNAVTLQAASLTANAATTLTGGGTYALAVGSTSLGNVHLGNSWRGTVRVSAATANGLNFGNLANASLSTIELNGFTGWSNQWKNGTNTENIRLTNPDADTYAWTNRADTTSVDGYATRFTGTWSGTGTFAVAPRALGYTFTGDISGWTGAMVNIDNRGYTSTITFAEDADVVKVAITDNASAKFAVVVNTDAVFSNNVAVHGSLTIAAGRTASFSGTNTFAGVTMSDGASLNIAGGSTTVSGSSSLKDVTVQEGGALSFAAGSTTALNGPISLEEQIANSGTLDFGGRNVAIALGGDGAASKFAIAAEGYTDIHDNEGDNGFHHTLGGTVIVNSGSGSIVNAGSVQVSFGGANYALHEEGTFGKDYDRSRYHVRSGSVDYSEIAGVSSISTVALSSNGTLNLNTALAANVGISSAGGTVNIAENVTLSHAAITANAQTTLSGKGRLELETASHIMPSNVVLGDDWSGVVAVSRLELKGSFDCTGLSTKNSWIEVKGLNGWLSNGVVIEDNLMLAKGNGDWAIEQNNGNNGSLVKFSGMLKGDGNIGRSVGTGSTYTYEFSGDIKGWTGNFISNNLSNHSTTFRVKDGATEINAELVNNGTDFRVDVQNRATFNAEVSATSLSLGSGATATFTSSAEFASLNGAGNLVVDSGSDTVTISGGGDSTGTITVDSGTLDLGGSQHTGIASLTINDGGKVITTNDNGNGFVGGTVTINAGGILEASGEAHDIFGYKKNNFTDAVVMNGSAGKTARIDLTYTAAGSVTMSTNLEMNGYSSISGKALNSFGGNVAASGAGNSISAIELREAVTIDVAQGGALEIGNLSRFAGFDGAIAKTGAGTLTLKGGVIDKAIAQSGGTLALDGNFTVDGLATVGDPIVYYAGAEDFNHRNNGVRGAWLDLQLRTADSTGSLSITGATRFTYGGQTMTGSAGEAGVIHLKSEGFTSTFYINEDSERTGWIFRAGADYPATDVSIARGATLVVDDNAAGGFNAGKIHVQDGTGYANLQIESGNTVNADNVDRALQLSGSGSYKLNGSLGLGSSLCTAEDGTWTGTIDAQAVNNWEKLFNMYTSANIHGGTVLLNTVTGESTTDGHALELQLGDHKKTEASYTFAQTTFKTAGGGNLRISDYTNAHTWIVGTGTFFDVSGDMRLDQKQTLSIQGGVVQTGGRIVLGHSQSGTGASGLSMTSGSLTMDGIIVIANSSSVSPISITGGTVEFTPADATASVISTTGNASASVNIGATGNESVTLKADGTSWTLAHDGMNIGNITAVTTGDNSITLGAEGMSANYTGKIQVAQGSHLTLNGASTIQQTIQNGGTLTIGSNLATTGLELHEQQDVNVQLDGTVTLAADANYFTGAKADYIVLAEGHGTVSPGGHTLTKDAKEYTIQTNGLAVGNITGDYTNFYQHEKDSTLNASDIAKKTRNMFSVDVQNATLNVDAAIAVTTANNARLLVQDPDYFLFGCEIAGGANEIVVQAGKALDLPNIRFDESAGEKVLQLRHADGSDYQVTDNTNARVRISSLREDTERQGRVTITAAAEAYSAFDISKDSFNVDATRLEKIVGGNVTVNNTLSVREVRNAEPGKAGDFILTQSVDAHALKGVIATSGNIEFRNMSSTERANLENLEIGGGKTVGFYSGGIADVAHEASVSVVGTLTAGKNAALNANLVMESGSTLDVAQTEGMGLLMGSEVTLSKGMTLNDYSGDWATWKDGTTYALFTGVDGLDIGNGVTTGTMDYTKWVDAKEYFSNIEESNRYFLCYSGAPDQNAVGVLTSVNNGSNVGMVYIMTMPEPTTGTLSLLALAALAARRRRKA